MPNAALQGKGGGDPLRLAAGSSECIEINGLEDAVKLAVCLSQIFESVNFNTLRRGSFAARRLFVCPRLPRSHASRRAKLPGVPLYIEIYIDPIHIIYIYIYIV